MESRNQFIEMNGLYWESDTHEWFNSNASTKYAQEENSNGISLKNITCFAVRSKETGEYDYVIMDNKKNCIVYDSKSLDSIGGWIDMEKIKKAYKI